MRAHAGMETSGGSGAKRCGISGVETGSRGLMTIRLPVLRCGAVRRPRGLSRCWRCRRSGLCWKKGFDPRRPEELLEAKKGVWCDYSQSFLTASPGGPGTVNTSTRLYDYLLDRIIVPEELLRALGWSEGVVDTSGIDMAHMQKLAG